MNTQPNYMRPATSSHERVRRQQRAKNRQTIAWFLAIGSVTVTVIVAVWG